jgi:POT family proton-dependent oligopeptide transporter
MVGNLYTPGDPKRDSGFNIFYMGINIGACLSALLSAPLRNEWTFSMAFVGAGVGLLLGVGNLLWNWRGLASADRRPEIDPRDVGLGRIVSTILLPAAAFGAIGYITGRQIPAIVDSLGPITFAFLVAMLPIGFYFITLVIRATPEEKPGLAALLPVYLAGGAFFMILHLNGGLITLFAEERTDRNGEWVPQVVQKYYCQRAMPSYFSNADPSLPRPPEQALLVVSGDIEAMFGAKRIGDSALDRVLQSYPDVKATQVGGKQRPAESPTTDWGFLTILVYRNDQVKIETTKDAHGIETTKVKVEPETARPLREVLLTREADGEDFPVLLVTEGTRAKVYAKASDARLAPGRFLTVLNAELIANFLNPFFVVFLTPVVVAVLSMLERAGKGISTARKILYGMLITILALLAMAGAAHFGGNGESKASVWWIVLFFGVITVGELLLSPMGLSLVTKLSPKRFVGLMLGGWFVSTAVGNKLSGFISGLEPTTRMFLLLSLALFAVAMVILVLQPMLNRAIKKYGA